MSEPVSFSSQLAWIKELPPPSKGDNPCPLCGVDMAYYLSISTRKWIPQSRCLSCEDKLKAADKARRTRDSIEAILVSCGVPRAIVNRAVELPTHAFDSVIDAIRGRRSLYIHGGCGVGKTLTIIHILRERILSLEIEPEQCLFNSSTRMCEYIRSGIDHGKGVYDRRLWEMCVKPLLLIDDLMAEPESKNNKDLIKQIICERYAHRRQTLITSNHTPDDALKYYGKRLGSRCSTMAALEFTGKDRRAAEDKW